LGCCTAARRARRGARPRRRLELQAFPPPFHRISGFPLADLQGVADAVGIKLYTMHWPMIARFWAATLPAGRSAALDAGARDRTAVRITDGPRTARVALSRSARSAPRWRDGAAREARTAQGRGGVPITAFVHSCGRWPTWYPP
jgi:hypothetical protein